MRERWIDHGNGMIEIETDTLTCRLRSRATKNYRHIESNWDLYFYIKGQFGYMCRTYCGFADTMEGAMNRAETMMREMFESIREIM